MCNYKEDKEKMCNFACKDVLRFYLKMYKDIFHGNIVPAYNAIIPLLLPSNSSIFPLHLPLSPLCARELGQLSSSIQNFTSLVLE